MTKWFFNETVCMFKALSASLELLNLSLFAVGQKAEFCFVEQNKTYKKYRIV